MELNIKKMSFSASQFIGKLGTLEDSQESINSASKWLLSQYREADNVANTWKDYMLKDSVKARRKLLGIYLLNHVVQQAKSQKIDHFQKAFSNVVYEVIKNVYPQLHPEMQKKAKRVVDIWYDRGIFPKDILQKLRNSILEINKTAKLDLESGKDKKTSSSRSGSIDKDRTKLSLELPDTIEQYAMLHKELRKLQQNAVSLKTRFDNSASELDPSSHVYEDNYNTVSKIANLAVDAVQKSMDTRQKAIDIIQSVLNAEKKQYEASQTMLTEINFSLMSKNPAKIQQIPEDNVLPTYTSGSNANDSSSDDDSDASDSSESSSDEKEEKQLSDLNDRKRSPDDNLNENDSSKKMKAIENEENVGETEKNELDEAEKNSENNGEDTGGIITSNIQDLLSKLAN